MTGGGIRGVLLDGDKKGRAAKPNAVAIQQCAGRRIGRRRFGRGCSASALADRLSVDERAIAAAEVV